MGATHQGALRGHVELGFGEEFAGGSARAHGFRIEQEIVEVEQKFKGTTDERR